MSQLCTFLVCLIYLSQVASQNITSSPVISTTGTLPNTTGDPTSSTPTSIAAATTSDSVAVTTSDSVAATSSTTAAAMISTTAAAMTSTTAAAMTSTTAAAMTSTTAVAATSASAATTTTDPTSTTPTTVSTPLTTTAVITVIGTNGTADQNTTVTLNASITPDNTTTTTSPSTSTTITAVVTDHDKTVSSNPSTVEDLNATTTTLANSTTTTVASDSQPSTSSVACGKPLSLMNGVVTPAQEAYSMGSKITYSCKEDYILECPSPLATCTVLGLWTYDCFPRCTKSTKEPQGQTNPYVIPAVAIIAGVVALGLILLFIGCIYFQSCQRKYLAPQHTSITDIPKSKRRDVQGISVYRISDDEIKLNSGGFQHDPNLFQQQEEISLDETQGASTFDSTDTVATTDLDAPSAADEVVVDSNVDVDEEKGETVTKQVESKAENEEEQTGNGNVPDTTDTTNNE